MIRAILGALLSHWLRQPLQLATLVLGLAMATGLWTGVQAINAEARASYKAASDTVSEATATLLRAPGRRISQAEFVALRRAGWQVDPVIEGRITLDGQRFLLRGLDLIGPGALAGGQDSGELEDLDRLFAHPDVAAGLTAPVPVTALKGLPRGELLADIPIAAQLLNRQIAFDHLALRPTQPHGQRPLARIAPDLVAQTPNLGNDQRLTDSFHLNLTAFGFLSFAVGLFIVHGAIGLAFEQRRPVLRSLRAIGAPARLLGWLLLAELSLIALVAGALGVAFGYLVAAALLPDVAATLRGLYGAEVGNALSLRPIWWATGLAMALIGAWVAGAGALWRVARMPLMASARPRAWAMASLRSFAVQALAGLVLWAIAVGMALWGTGLIAGFALLGAMLLGAALILPLVLAALMAGFARLAKRPMAQWFWADTRQQLPGLSLALMALLLALSANVGVGTMVSSFRLTFTGWLDQRLAADLYVTARSEAEAETLRSWLATRQDVTATLPIWSTETTWRGAPLELFTVTDHPIYRDNWPMLAETPDTWDRIGTNDGVLINEQMARRFGLKLEDMIDLGPAGQVAVAGVYSDYGNPNAQVLMATGRLLGAFPETARLRHGLAVNGGTTDLIGALQDQLELPRDAILEPSQIKAFSLGVFERTFTVTAALNVLTLSVAGFAILTSLLTLAAMRLPQLAPVWALGQTRAQLARLEGVRAVVLAALTFVLALPLGLLLAWALLAIVNVAAFGWRLPMFTFPMQWAGLFALSLLAALLAALWPALKLARLAPSALLRSFANER